MMEKQETRVVIFIDLPNFTISLKQLGYEINKGFRRLLKAAGSYGKIVEGYIYADFEKFKLNFSIQRELLLRNIRFIYCPANSNGENKIDDPMLIEGVHGLLRRNSDFFYVLVTSDIVILPLSMTLRSLNKSFRIFGFSQCASSLLRSLPEFIDLNRTLQREDDDYQNPLKRNETFGTVVNQTP